MTPQRCPVEYPVGTNDDGTLRKRRCDRRMASWQVLCPEHFADLRRSAPTLCARFSARSNAHPGTAATVTKQVIGHLEVLERLRYERRLRP